MKQLREIAVRQTIEMMQDMASTVPTNQLRAAKEMQQLLAEVLRLRQVVQSQALRNVTRIAQEREWVGLTDEEIALIVAECASSAHRHDDFSFARAIEAKLKEKNNA